MKSVLMALQLMDTVVLVNRLFFAAVFSAGLSLNAIAEPVGDLNDAVTRTVLKNPEVNASWEGSTP